MDLGSPQLRACCRVGHERQRSEGRHDCDPPKRRMSAVDDNPWLRSNGAMRSTRFPSACADLPQCLQSDVEGEAAVRQYRSRYHRHTPPNLPLLCYCLRGRPSPAHSRRSDQRFRRNAHSRCSFQAIVIVRERFLVKSRMPAGASRAAGQDQLGYSRPFPCGNGSHRFYRARRSASACAHSLIVMLHLRGARASRSQLRVHAQ
jgi:hypothetical protein